MYNFCKVLAKEYKVDLLVVNEGNVERSAIEELESIGVRVIVFDFSRMRFRLNALQGVFLDKPLQVGYYFFKEVQAWITTHIHEYDIALCNHIRSAEYLRHLPVKKIIDLHDAISLNYARASKHASGLWKWIYTIENKRVLPYELKCIESFDKSLIVSQVDKEFLAQSGAPSEKICVLPVAIDELKFQHTSGWEEKNWIVFVGKMDTVANSDAAVYFALFIFPRIRAIMPNIEFYIVGADPSPSVQRLGKIPGVHVTGNVENHIDYLRQAKVVIDPMRFGAGMQNKVLEAMALGKPVVASKIATEGIEGEDGVHYLVADAPEDVVSQIVALFSDGSLRERLGDSGKKLVREKYSWNVVARSLLAVVNEVTGS